MYPVSREMFLLSGFYKSLQFYKKQLDNIIASGRTSSLSITAVWHNVHQVLCAPIC